MANEGRGFPENPEFNDDDVAVVAGVVVAVVVVVDKDNAPWVRLR